MPVKRNFTDSLKSSGCVFGNKNVANRTFHGTFTKRQVYNVVKQFMNDKKGKYNWFQLSLNIVDDGVGLKSCPSFNDKEEPNILPQYDWDKCDGFVLYVCNIPNGSLKPQNRVNQEETKEETKEEMKEETKEETKEEPATTLRRSKRLMGDSKFNDCLFDCIVGLLGKYRLPINIKTPETFKNAIGINRCEKIPMEKIPKVEEILKVNINISGDYEYISKNKQPVYTANLILKNEHVEIAENNLHSTKLLSYIPKFTQSELITYYIKDDSVICYNGKYFTMQLKEFQKQRKDVYSNTSCYRGCVKEEDLHIEYINILNDTKLLKAYSFGKHDLARSSYKLTKEAIKTLHYSTLSLREPEPIIEEEEMPLHNAFCGGLMFCNPSTLNNGRLIDINSFYLSVLASDKFTFPLTRGKFELYKEFPRPFFEYGIYHCVVHRCENPNINRLFYFNKRNYYTNFCLTTAKELGLKIELIQDGKPNVRLYKVRGQGKHYFEPMINEFYSIKLKMKEDECESKVANKLLHRLFGTLSQKNKRYSKIGEIFDMSNPNIADQKIRKVGKHHIVSYVEHGSFFKYDYARIGPFLTAMCRRKLYEVVKPYNQHIYRVFTDSILYDADAINIDVPISDKIGCWKIEMENMKCIIQQHEKPVWIKNK